MRITYLVSMKSDLESFIYKEIEFFSKNGHEVKVISLFASRSDNVYSPVRFASLTHLTMFLNVAYMLKYFVLKPISFFNVLREVFSHGLYREFIFCFHFAAEIKKSCPDLVQVHFGDRKFFIASLAKKLEAFKLHLTVHAHEIYANPNERYFRSALTNVNKITSISQKNSDLLVNRFDCDPKKIVVQYLGIDTKNFSPFSADHKFVLTVSRWTERKGIFELLDAAQCFKEQNVTFLLVGWGDIDVAHEIKIRELNNVICFPKLNQEALRVLYHLADAFILPSKNTEQEGSEGIPVVLMEAKSMCTPVLSSRDGSIEEIHDGPFLETVDANSIAMQLDLLLSKNQDEIALMTSNARLKIEKSFNNGNLDKQLEIFQSLLND